MSTSMLKKSLKLFEDKKSSLKSGVHKTLNKHRKNANDIISKHKNSKRKAKKNIEENLKKLKLLTSYKVSKDVSDKIFRHVHKDFIPLEDKQKPAKDEKTVFTEEDFEAFEREYNPDN